MNQSLFFHGFGFSPHVWGKRSPGDLFYDRGYFGNPQNVPFSSEKLVCHSMGLHFIEKEHLKKCKHLVILSGFIKFSESETIIEKMINNLNKNSRRFLKEFYLACGYRGEIEGEINETLLREDLQYLKEAALDITPFLVIERVSIIYGKEDKIITLAQINGLKEAIPQSELIMIDGGHMESIHYFNRNKEI